MRRLIERWAGREAKHNGDGGANGRRWWLGTSRWTGKAITARVHL